MRTISVQGRHLRTMSRFQSRLFACRVDDVETFFLHEKENLLRKALSVTKLYQGFDVCICEKYPVVLLRQKDIEVPSFVDFFFGSLPKVREFAEMRM